MKTLIRIGTALAAAGGMALSAGAAIFPTDTPPSSAKRKAGEPAKLTRAFFTEDEEAPRHEPAVYDVTIVEYLDYQCPHCRIAHGELKKLVARDKKVRIIYRDWPVFGPASEQAARLAIASKWQGKHAAFHDALMRAGQLDSAAIRAAAKAAGVNWTRLQADASRHSDKIDALLARNNYQAEALGLTGTPGFIVGETLVPGTLDLNDLQNLVAKSRKAAAR